VQAHTCVFLQVDLFLLVYGGTGRNEEHVRRALLQRRNEWLVTGMGEEDLTEGMVRASCLRACHVGCRLQEEIVYGLLVAQSRKT